MYSIFCVIFFSLVNMSGLLFLYMMDVFMKLNLSFVMFIFMFFLFFFESMMMMLLLMFLFVIVSCFNSEFCISSLNYNMLVMN